MPEKNDKITIKLLPVDSSCRNPNNPFSGLPPDKRRIRCIEDLGKIWADICRRKKKLTRAKNRRNDR